MEALKDIIKSPSYCVVAVDLDLFHSPHGPTVPPSHWLSAAVSSWCVPRMTKWKCELPRLFCVASRKSTLVLVRC